MTTIREPEYGTDLCPEHGEQEIVTVNEYVGFAGGACAVWVLACGCTVADESADVRAAR